LYISFESLFHIAIPMGINISQQKEKIKAACQPVSEAQYKNYTILTSGLFSAALAKEEARKLHPSSSAAQITQ
jgi:hypothetical protein